MDLQNINGEDADRIHKDREAVRESTTTFAEHMRDDGVEAAPVSWGHTWREFLSYVQRGDNKDTARENVQIKSEVNAVTDREPYPTLYPGEVKSGAGEDEENRTRRRNFTRLTQRARNNKHKQERKKETYGEKRVRLAKGGEGTRVISTKPPNKEGGGEWRIPETREDKAARELLGGLDQNGRYRVFTDDTMDLAHEAEYAGHPILRIFTRPEENEHGPQKIVTTEDTRHMNGTAGKKLTYEALTAALTLHERHDFHVAVATDGAKRGGTKDRMEAQRISETTYGVWQGPESAKILKRKQGEANTLQERLGVQLNHTDKVQAVEQGILSGRLGDSATSAEAELFAIFAILRKVQALQDMGHYKGGKARVLIMSDCLSGLEIIEKVWRGKKNTYRKLNNGAVIEAITNVRESLGTVIFMWIPSHVGIVPNIIADSIASRDQEEPPEGMITGMLSKQVRSRPIIYAKKVQGRVELADGPIYWEARQCGKRFIRSMHKPPEGGDKCQGEVAKGMTNIEGIQGEDATWDMELAEIVGRNEMEKFVHGIRNGEIVGGPAYARRMKHATREGNKTSFWTYLKVNGCRGCQRQEEEETIHHVISG
eukprot:6211911-Pleurochrysis_carterae.AAC.1